MKKHIILSAGSWEDRFADLDLDGSRSESTYVLTLSALPIHYDTAYGPHDQSQAPRNIETHVNVSFYPLRIHHVLQMRAYVIEFGSGKIRLNVSLKRL